MEQGIAYPFRSKPGSGGTSNLKTGSWGLQESQPYPPNGLIGLGVPGTQRWRWVYLAVEILGPELTDLLPEDEALGKRCVCALKEQLPLAWAFDIMQMDWRTSALPITFLSRWGFTPLRL